MVTVVANKLAMTAKYGSPSTIYTDPIDLGENDRGTAMMNVHYLWLYGTAAAATIQYTAQVSNDGLYWVDATGLTKSESAPTGATPSTDTGEVNGQFIRFKIVLTVTAGDLAGTAIDLHVKFDHI